MATSKPEKRMKKIKKIKKRASDVVDNGEAAGCTSLPECDDKHDITGMNKDDAVGAEVIVHKSKKARKHRAHTSASGVMSIVVNDGEDIELVFENHSKGRKGKAKRVRKLNKDSTSAVTETNSLQELQEIETADVYQILGEDDDSKAMKKWIKEYNEKRPGLKISQDRIDDFITAHDEQEEQAKRERDARLAEEGWTAVIRRKGGKKTTDPESGVAVGSVAEAAVLDKLTKKKSKDVGLGFYRFQRKEAHRNDIMKLQSKFEEDKKRIRAKRKFRPDRFVLLVRQTPSDVEFVSKRDNSLH